MKSSTIHNCLCRSLRAVLPKPFPKCTICVGGLQDRWATFLHTSVPTHLAVIFEKSWRPLLAGSRFWLGLKPNSWPRQTWPLLIHALQLLPFNKLFMQLKCWDWSGDLEEMFSSINPYQEEPMLWICTPPFSLFQGHPVLLLLGHLQLEPN